MNRDVYTGVGGEGQGKKVSNGAVSGVAAPGKTVP